jgi:RNA polymerase sigma factor (sigma-70 family)
MSSWLENDGGLAGRNALDDEQLLSAYAGGDEEAFESLVKQYFGLVYSVALRRVQDPSLAEEAAQSTFIILARKAKTLSSGVRLRGWLLKTARFVCNDALKTQRRRLEHEEALEVHLGELAKSEVDYTAAKELLEEAILALPAVEQTCVVARFYEGRTFREVAHILGISEDGAQKRISRSLKKLHRYLSRRGTKTTDAALSGLLGTYLVPPAPEELVHSSLRVILEAGHGTLAGGLAMTLAGRCMRVLARREWALLGVKVMLPLVLLVCGGWASLSLSRGPAPNTVGFKPSDPRVEALGKAWSVVVLRAATAKQTFRRIPGPNDPAFQAYMTEMQFAVNETTRISTQLQATLNPARERTLMAEFLTVELRETLGLDADQQRMLFDYLRDGLSQGATLKEAMKAMAQSTSVEAGQVKARLSGKQRQIFDRVYGADGLCLFQYLKVASV